MRRDSSRAIAIDSEGHELRINDNVKEVDGEGRKGRVLHTHQSFFAFYDHPRSTQCAVLGIQIQILPRRSRFDVSRGEE